MPVSAVRSPQQLRDDALAIWQAGVAAVRSDRLVKDNLRVEGRWLHVGEEALSLDDIARIIVVGGGKAGTGMAAGVVAALGAELMREKQVAGWVNVPADCIVSKDSPAVLEAGIHLHAARPAGVNEPTEAGVEGTRRILELVAGLGPNDLCLCLLSGGGSALLPAPVPGVSLADKQAVTRFLSGKGANIRQLNTVRKQLSLFKGGGLARACRAGRLISLIISDVLGDPLDIIASGPTVADSSTPGEALAILEQFGARQAGLFPTVLDYLAGEACNSPAPSPQPPTPVYVIGNNAVAVDAAGVEAERRGYSHAMVAATTLEAAAEDVGRQLAEQALLMRSPSGPDCLITGGEPTVRLAPPEIRGRGGRNQQLVLAALEHLETRGGCQGIAILSGGTDGEDAPPTPPAPWIDAASAQTARELGLSPADYLARNDAYHFFEPLGTLLATGPTFTNVCDVRVVLVERA